jgi:signal transduction histidine kinase
MTIEATHDLELDLAREREIERYQVVGVPQPELDDLAAVAATLCHVPAVAINLMRADTQVTIAVFGMEPMDCAREDSMCNVIIDRTGPVMISDTSLDPRWSGNPYVNGEEGSIRFYSAERLVSPRGVVVGTMCVFDYVSRVLTPEEQALLQRVARRVVDLLELRLRTHELEQTVVELTAARAELQRSNEMLDLFAGQIAHDLRGPLTGLTMTLGTLRDEIDTDDTDQSWVLDRALSSVSRMNTLIRDMLDFASLGSTAEVGEVDLDEVVVLVRTDLVAALDGVRFEVGSLPVVPGRATQWRVVVQNLVANAVKFTRHLEEPLVRVSAGAGADGWWLEVADNGPGVPATDRERVFDLMTQGDPTQEGIGLGLATCKRIVRAHGGSIRIQDAPEGGALVRIAVPAS